MVEPAFHLLAAALWLVTLVVTLRRYPRVRGTTLVAPWAWLSAACGLLAWSQLGEGWSGNAAWQPLLKHTAVVATLCPIVAVFGAKRPQARYWWFIVATLGLVLVLPALEAILSGRSAPDASELRAAFYWVLTAMAVLNYGATRFAVPILLAGLSQSILLADLLHVLPSAGSGTSAILAAGCALGAQILVRPRSLADPVDAANHTWLDFRDGYGAVWALRLAQRMNVLARQRRGAGIVLWSGVTGDRQFRRTVTVAIKSLFGPAWLSSPNGAEEAKTVLRR